MDFQPFSLNNNKNQFPGFELVIVVFLLLAIYVIGILLIPNVIDRVEQFVFVQNEQRLIEIVQQSSMLEEVEVGMQRTYTLRELLNDGIIERSENKLFFARYSLNSNVTVTSKDGICVYSVRLIKVD